MNDRLLEVRHLCIDYAVPPRKQLRAVDDIAFSLDSGRTLGIAGASGSGKTSVAMALLGLLDGRTTRCSGSMMFYAHDLMALDEAGWRAVRGRQIGAIFQSPQQTFNPTMTIGQHLEEAIRCHAGNSAAGVRQQALQALEQAGMPRAAEVLRNYAFELSGGMCQRAAIALALVQQPRLLIADEPTSSLDVLAQVDICRLLQNLRRQHGLSMIVISHDLGLIGQLADDVAVMNAGQVVEAGTAADVFGGPEHAYTRQLLASAIGLPPLHAAERSLQT